MDKGQAKSSQARMQLGSRRVPGIHLPPLLRNHPDNLLA